MHRDNEATGEVFPNRPTPVASVGSVAAGTEAFSVAVAAYGTALYLIAAPVVAPFDTIELGIWQPDTWSEGLALVPLGLVLLLAAGWISEGMAAMSRALARWGAR